MRYEDFAFDRTATRRKDDRRHVRHALGTSSDGAPTVHEALVAVVHLDDLLHCASGGIYKLQIVRQSTGETLRPVEAVTQIAAIKREHEERAERVAEQLRHERNERALTEAFGEPGAVTRIDLPELA